MQSLFSLSISSMSEEEQKSCGIERLSVEEKKALDAWLARVEPPKTSSKVVHGEFAVVENIKLGRFIKLDNGITYDIPSRSRKKTMGWKPGEKVRVVEQIRSPHYKLEFVAEKMTIGAKVAKKP
jgi:hypothetical protein